jgi:hypothetical protein
MQYRRICILIYKTIVHTYYYILRLINEINSHRANISFVLSYPEEVPQSVAHLKNQVRVMVSGRKPISRCNHYVDSSALLTQRNEGDALARFTQTPRKFSQRSISRVIALSFPRLSPPANLQSRQQSAEHRQPAPLPPSYHEIKHNLRSSKVRHRKEHCCRPT